jgi:biopolymer transport protein ExbB/biopolymer transport protein TolQ
VWVPLGSIQGRLRYRVARAPSNGSALAITTENLWRISTVTILLSILGSKALGFFALLFQEAAKGGEDLKSAFTITEMVKNLGWVALTVIIILLIMSMYSIAIMVERFLTYSAAKKQSREFAPRVAQALKNDRIEEAINISDKHKKSHLAMVVNAGLQEFRAHDQSSDISGDEIEASKRALQRAIAIKSAEFKRGLSGLATIGSTAPFVGLFGTVFGIINAFTGMKSAESAGIGAVAGGIAEALLTTALGLAVAVPAVWLFNYFTGKVDGFIIEMDNSASELIDYFLKNRTRQLRS